MIPPFVLRAAARVLAAWAMVPVLWGRTCTCDHLEGGHLGPPLEKIKVTWKTARGKNMSFPGIIERFFAFFLFF